MNVFNFSSSKRVNRLKDMKVLLVNGSPRKSGNTFLALSEIAKTLNEKAKNGLPVREEWQPMHFIR